MFIFSKITNISSNKSQNTIVNTSDIDIDTNNNDDIENSTTNIEVTYNNEEINNNINNNNDNINNDNQNITEITNNNSTNINYNQIKERTWINMKWFGYKVFEGIESVGESVADFIGLNDSRFQYVIDGMSDEDWVRAIEIDRQRRENEANNNIEGNINGTDNTNDNTNITELEVDSNDKK